MNPIVEFDKGTHRLKSRGDAGVWLAPIPLPDGATDTVPVLRFSTAGRSYTVQLSLAELERLADSADAILAATEAEVDAMLDTAALALRQHYMQSAAAREMTTGQPRSGSRATPRQKAGSRPARPRSSTAQ